MTRDELRARVGAVDGQPLPRYTSWGCYPLVYLTKDGLTICAACAERGIDPCQAVIAADVYYEGPVLLCEDCQEQEIASAYGDPAAPEAEAGQAGGAS